MNKLAILSVLALLGCASGFQSPQRSTVGFGVKSTSNLFLVKASSGNDDFPPDDESEYTGSVDWDAEWKKVVADDGKLARGERPGQDFYKSEAEVAAIKATNRAAFKAAEMRADVSNSMSMPDMKSLSGDPKVSSNTNAILIFASLKYRSWLITLLPLSFGLPFWQSSV
jgi:hypothetical protein